LTFQLLSDKILGEITIVCMSVEPLHLRPYLVRAGKIGLNGVVLFLFES